jgi:hypothetical protein
LSRSRCMMSCTYRIWQLEHHPTISIGLVSPMRGHRTVFEDPCDVLCAHAPHGGGVTIPLHRTHGLVWLPTSDVPYVSTSPAMVRPSKFLCHLRLGHLGESCMDRFVQLGTSGVHVSKSNHFCLSETCA